MPEMISDLCVPNPTKVSKARSALPRLFFNVLVDPVSLVNYTLYQYRQPGRDLMFFVDISGAPPHCKAYIVCCEHHRDRKTQCSAKCVRDGLIIRCTVPLTPSLLLSSHRPLCLPVTPHCPR